MNSPFITAENISIRIGNKFLFDGDSWTMNRGEQWAIVGSNGAGKSSFVKALAGRLSIRSGMIVFHFGDSSKEPYPISQKDAVAYVSFDLHKQVIIHEEKQVEFLSLVGQDSHSPLSSLSTGQVRKKLLIDALQKKPELLILDEPFEGLDVENKNYFMESIEELITEGIHLILVTHHAEEIMDCITHALVIANGHIVQQGLKSVVMFDSDGIVPTASRMLDAIGTSSRRRSGLAMTPRAFDKYNLSQEFVSLKNVTIRFGDIIALNNISWSMHQGENWVILGPNGSGKSTLVSLIIGDEPQAYGQDIRIFGKQKGSGESVWDIKKNIGYISTDLHLEHREHVQASHVIISGLYDSVGLYRAPSAADTEALGAWSERMGITDLINRDFLSLSTGQQRLVLIARCLIKSPALIIADEPCHGLDRRNRARALAMFDSACRNGSNLIFITHRKDEIIPSTTHMLVLEDGAVKASGLRAEMMHNHF